MINENVIVEVYETLKSRRDSPINSYTSNLMKDSDKLAEDKILE
ncbi:MAG: phosphoribosyl-ATP pyrophosphatase, partial [Methanobrevibacter sp.]|nr:phosphoribosyl-ATP pyrophosphatase [Candidatus Methanovirga procula]